MQRHGQQLCPVCRGGRLTVVTSRFSRYADCGDCFHRVRLDVQAFDYRAVEMGGRMNGDERLAAQIAFFRHSMPEGARILEIGCAAGRLAAAIRAGNPSATYIGIELSPAGRHAAEIVDRLFDQPLEALLTSGEIKPHSIDLIVCSHVLEHIPDIGATTAAMVETLAPDGAVFLEVPNGSGHPALRFDENPSHLHGFNITSLSRLLSMHGLRVTAAETGAHHDIRYPDSIRVIARRAPAPVSAASWPFSATLRKIGIERVIVWGAGKMALEILSDTLAPENIAFFVDRDSAKQGQTLLGREVGPPEMLSNAPDLPILISSLDHADAIAGSIARDFADPPRRVVTVQELLSATRSTSLGSPNR